MKKNKTKNSNFSNVKLIIMNKSFMKRTIIFLSILLLCNYNAIGKTFVKREQGGTPKHQI